MRPEEKSDDYVRVHNAEQEEQNEQNDYVEINPYQMYTPSHGRTATIRVYQDWQ
jgi:hypothetical protein